jgi:DNA-binding transcriptional ArsR family regulator
MDPLSQTFSALADPTRRAILARLATGAATVGDLAEPFDMSLPAVSRHLKVLTEAGLIERHTVAALQPARRRFSCCRRLDGDLPPVLGAAVRPARRLSQAHRAQAFERKAQCPTQAVIPTPCT